MYILDLFFPLYFTKFSLNTVSIRVKFGSSKEKITTRRIYICLIPETNYFTKVNYFQVLMQIFNIKLSHEKIPLNFVFFYSLPRCRTELI